jgi:hypothetical protein
MRISRMQESERGGTIRVELPTHGAFVENNNSTFRVEAPAGKKLEIRLTDVSDRKVWERQEEFSITFRSAVDAFIPQGTYRFEHEKLGSFELFIVPVGKDDRGHSYEAVFNNLRDPA